MNTCSSFGLAAYRIECCSLSLHHYHYCFCTFEMLVYIYIYNYTYHYYITDSVTFSQRCVHAHHRRPFLGLIYCLRFKDKKGQTSPVTRRQLDYWKTARWRIFQFFVFIVSFYCPKSTENRTAVIVIHVSCCVSKVIATETILHSFV